MKNSRWTRFQKDMFLYSLMSMVLSVITVMAFLAVVVLILRITSGDEPKLLQNVNLSNSFSENVIQNYGYQVVSVNYLQKYIPFLILLIVAATLVGIGSFLIYFQMFTRKTAICVHEISAGIDEIAAGDLYKEIPVSGNDEIANIAEKLNSMTVEIRQLIESEHQYEQEKDTLITNVAHDLRTPLTSVIGYLDLVRRNNQLSMEDKHKYVNVAYDKAKRLEKLIEDLFEFTKVGAELQVHPVEIDFKRFMEQMVEEFYPSFDAEGLECQCVMDDEDIMIVADGDLLARGVSNLISNSVKYGKDGKLIKIRLKKNEAKRQVSLEIINYGKIIAPEDIDHIFDKFYRGEASRSTETGGSGLGLAIAKKVVQIHHGVISVKSDYHGTSFKMVLPFSKEDAVSIEEEVE
ncbi:MAG: HAMP domain-containing histidine kinase [Lachnospiraceae bacterium]|nr:HAMP domain-containing histidine kinase [Lachnospiraceae bacterium]